MWHFVCACSRYLMPCDLMWTDCMFQWGWNFWTPFTDAFAELQPDLILTLTDGLLSIFLVTVYVGFKAFGSFMKCFKTPVHPLCACVSQTSCYLAFSRSKLYEILTYVHLSTGVLLLVFLVYPALILDILRFFSEYYPLAQLCRFNKNNVHNTPLYVFHTFQLYFFQFLNYGFISTAGCC